MERVADLPLVIVTEVLKDHLERGDVGRFVIELDGSREIAGFGFEEDMQTEEV